MSKKKTKLYVKGSKLIDTLKKTDLKKYGYKEGEKIALVFNKNKCVIQPWLKSKMKEILDLDASIFKILQKSHYFDTVNKKFLASGRSNTCFGFACLIASLTSVKLGIFSLCEEKNEYSAKILLRVLIEHFLKVNYFFFRHCNEKDDSVGIDYQVFADAEEPISLAKSASHVKRLLKTSESHDPNLSYKLLCELHPVYTKYKKKEVLDKVKQFSYIQILDYIFREYTKNKDAKELRLLLNLIPKYAELSSYVHGGPSATRVSAISIANNKIDEECVEIANSAVNITIVSLLFACIIFGQIDSSFFAVKNQIWNRWQKYEQENESK